MKCSCCGRRKRIREVFETVSDEVNICVDCGQLLYKIKEAERERNDIQKNEYMNEIVKRSSKKGSEEFISWFNSEYFKE